MSQEIKVLLADPMTEQEVVWVQGLAPVEAMRMMAPSTSDRSELLGLAREAEFIVSKKVVVDADLIRQAPRLKLIQKYGSFRSQIDVAAAQAAGIQVATMRLLGTIAVAELVMTLILALSKRLFDADRGVRQGGYEELGLEPKLTSERSFAFQWMQLWEVAEVWGETLGIVGLGEIGIEVARRAMAFGMPVLYLKRNRYKTDEEKELGVKWAGSLEHLLKESRFVSLNVPLTEDTSKMIGERELGWMRKDAFLINTARGGVLDEGALFDALRSGEIAGAGLDVFTYEPLPKESPLNTLSNVILAPHIGGGSGAGNRERQMRDVLENVARVLRGEEPENRVV